MDQLLLHQSLDLPAERSNVHSQLIRKLLYGWLVLTIDFV